MNENYEFEKATGKLAFPLTNDMLFHIVMQKNLKALINLLAALLGIAAERITNVLIENPIDFNKVTDGKEIILDLRVTIKDLRTLNIELQVAQYFTWTARSVYYLCRTLDDQKPQKDYSGLLPVTQICIMDFQLFDDHREFFGRYRLLNEKDGYLYSDLISIYVLDLNATDLATQEDKDHGLVIWAEMFKASTWDEIRKIADSHPVMKGVAQTMYEAVTDRESYRQIREHEKAVLDQQAMQAYAENIGYKKGEIKGEIKGKIEGKIEGKMEGKIEGEAINVIKLTMNKVKKGKGLAEIADDLESTEVEIRPVYETVMRHRDITDPEKIYEILEGANMSK